MWVPPRKQVLAFRSNYVRFFDKKSFSDVALRNVTCATDRVDYDLLMMNSKRERFWRCRNIWTMGSTG
ncbi:unnamed protein product [Bursaphelenchus okinawaensis]|uniref:Uncharacterized protein n=1 Tax=Bursaphelenchus okinawaensis TaxID=465554 RepID=A0A811LTD1_9BILA|nr:unnamed protein product [Bursaphelenchus okinawaensis]CAG9127687.1 unnamed protein product [Bursaphelenchus okinawaensis]